ncbi:OLC1v1014167C1 [Oldenlandia corymbosa var. corymbosa]|uniref:OLC1v1014167C1 n=1 Tax=Oldenlandia corymbosa var. corymbosa TaxID=529605 RepID=A0AAV1E3H6_OLDCO|nr:OLC1v1014167C1 [Oldenlandia corymbosa var. corymbosa]
MADTPERENERTGSSSRPLHNFTLPSLNWGNQRQLRCVRTQSSTPRNVPTLSANVLSQQSRSPITVSRRSPARPVTTNPISPPRADKGKSAITSTTSDGCMDEVKTVSGKLYKDLVVCIDGQKIHFVDEKRKDKVEEPKPAEVRWNLRNRGGMGKTTNESGKTVWPMWMNDRGYKSLLASDKGETNGGREPRRNKFSVQLSKADIEEDFLVMTGAKPPRKPKKRSKPIQKQIDALFPGAWLSEVSAERYKVREMPEPKEK